MFGRTIGYLEKVMALDRLRVRRTVGPILFPTITRNILRQHRPPTNASIIELLNDFIFFAMQISYVALIWVHYTGRPYFFDNPVNPDFGLWFGLLDPDGDPDRHPNLSPWSLGHALQLQDISSKSVHNFSSYPTDRQTDWSENVTFFGGGNYGAKPHDATQSAEPWQAIVRLPACNVEVLRYKHSNRSLLLMKIWDYAPVSGTLVASALYHYCLSGRCWRWCWWMSGSASHRCNFRGGGYAYLHFLEWGVPYPPLFRRMAEK